MIVASMIAKKLLTAKFQPGEGIGCHGTAHEVADDGTGHRDRRVQKVVVEGN